MKMHKAGLFFLFSLLVSLLLSACTGSADQSANDVEEDFDSTLVLPRTELTRVSEFRTPSGKVWRVKETPMLDSSMVNVTVEAIGFGGDSVTFDFGEIDPVIAIHEDDLDKDGFGELYLVSQSMGSDSYGTIAGLYSNKDQSISMISYEGATPYTMKEGEPYEGYMGHDHFEFVESVLRNTYPVYTSEDTNAQPTGGKREVVYELVKGEASMLLRPVRKK